MIHDPCQTFRDRLGDIADAVEASVDPAGSSPGDELFRELVDHAASCPRCGEELRTYRQVVRWVRELPPLRAPASFATDIRRRLDHDRRSPSSSSGGGATGGGSSLTPPAASYRRAFVRFAAILVLASIAGIWFAVDPERSPSDFVAPASPPADELRGVARVDDRAKLRSAGEPIEGASLAQSAPPVPDDPERAPRVVLAYADTATAGELPELEARLEDGLARSDVTVGQDGEEWVIHFDVAPEQLVAVEREVARWRLEARDANRPMRRQLARPATRSPIERSEPLVEAAGPSEVSRPPAAAGRRPEATSGVVARPLGGQSPVEAGERTAAADEKRKEGEDDDEEQETASTTEAELAEARRLEWLRAARVRPAPSASAQGQGQGANEGRSLREEAEAESRGRAAALDEGLADRDSRRFDTPNPEMARDRVAGDLASPGEASKLSTAATTEDALAPIDLVRVEIRLRRAPLSLPASAPAPVEAASEPAETPESAVDSESAADEPSSTPRQELR